MNISPRLIQDTLCFELQLLNSIVYIHELLKDKKVDIQMQFIKVNPNRNQNPGIGHTRAGNPNKQRNPDGEAGKRSE